MYFELCIVREDIFLKSFRHQGGVRKQQLFKTVCRDSFRNQFKRGRGELSLLPQRGHNFHIELR